MTYRTMRCEKRLERQAKKYEELNTIMNHPVGFNAGVKNYVVENVTKYKRSSNWTTPLSV